MDHESTATHGFAPPSPTWLRTAIMTGAFVGVVGALAAFIEGIVLMAKRKVADCPNGHFFPLGTTDFRCYAHPRAAEGFALSAISLSVGVIVLLLVYLSLATHRGSEAH